MARRKSRVARGLDIGTKARARFRQEKRELEKFGKQVIEDLEREIKSLNSQLSTYADLEDKET